MDVAVQWLEHEYDRWFAEGVTTERDGLSFTRYVPHDADGIAPPADTHAAGMIEIKLDTSRASRAYTWQDGDVTP
ncbi:hypothetical protein ABGB09_34080 [Streptomyces sp. B8F3]|uniref:hypothetical protein n=1 Tax=Streptomyces sp. B8F3 TaxID=3153573 RepID=UPI00325CE93A